MHETRSPRSHIQTMRQGACGYPYGHLPQAGSGGGNIHVLGKRIPQETRYPGDRPTGSFVLNAGIVHPLKWSDGEWAVDTTPGSGDWCGLESWLAALRAPLLAQRQACLAYGSNLSPLEIDRYAADGPVVVLEGLLMGAAAAYCASTRSDGQYPAGLVASSRNRGEMHGLVLVDEQQRMLLDAKEGVSGRIYQRGVFAADSIDFVLQNGTKWTGPLGVYLQQRRHLALSNNSPVLLADMDQEGFAALDGLSSTATHGLDFQRVEEFPSVSTAGIPLFTYGTLQPGQFRHQAVRDFVDAVSSDSVHGVIVDTGQDYPGLVPFSDGEVSGTLLHPKAGQQLALLDRCDAIEGHPLLFRRALVRTASETLAWVYFWQTPSLISDSL